MKLIFINGIPTSMIFGKKIDPWWFFNNGFEVEFWDTSLLYYTKEQLESYYGGNEEYNFIGPNHKTVSNITMLIDLIQNLNIKNSVILYLSRTIYKMIEDDDVLEIVQKSKIPFFLKQFEMAREPKSIKDRLLNHLKMLVKHKQANKKLKPNGYFGCGNIVRQKVIKSFPKTEFISIPSPKIQWKRQPRIIDEDYIVFVDESIEYAPDAKMHNYQICDDLNGYYSRMNKLFSNLENWLGLPVIIAASGKYIYPENKFLDRKIMYKQTFSLIEHSSLIVGHTSSALDHNIKCKKPMLFIDDKSFTQYKRRGFKKAVTLEGNKLHISDEITEHDIKDILSYDNKEFNKLIDDYFKEDGVDEDYKEILANTFRKSIVNKI